MNEVRPVNPELQRSNNGSASSLRPVLAAQGAADGKSLPTDDAVRQMQQLKDSSKAVKSNTESMRARMEAAVERMNERLQSMQRELHFSLDESSGQMVVTVVDSKTSEVVRQIPSDVMLKLAQKLREDEPLRLFSAKV
jgi:flagellar protein FlaG